MTPLWGNVIGIFTVLLLIVFVGIWIWVWLPYHRRKYDAMARLPMQDEDGDAP